jgi:hypothetical protein
LAGHRADAVGVIAQIDGPQDGLLKTRGGVHRPEQGMPDRTLDEFAMVDSEDPLLPAELDQWEASTW